MLPADPYAGLPDRTRMRDDSGDVLLVFSPSQSLRDATPYASRTWVPRADLVLRAAGHALEAMSGWLLSTADAHLAAALTAGGATERRHVSRMTHSLGARPDPPGGPSDAPPADDVTGAASGTGVRVEPLTKAQVERQASRIGAVNFRAYPAAHPDAFDGDQADAVQQIRAVARGEVLGPMLPQSRVAILDNAIVGACLVVASQGHPPHGGPWLLDLFREPGEGARGAGRAMLESSLAGAREAGLPAVSLVVSRGNERARSLYLGAGFEEVCESWTLALP